MFSRYISDIGKPFDTQYNIYRLDPSLGLQPLQLQSNFLVDGNFDKLMLSKQSRPFAVPSSRSHCGRESKNLKLGVIMC